MEINKLFVYEDEAREAIQERANKAGAVYGEVNIEVAPTHIEPETKFEREKMLMNFFLYERKTWHFNAFELVDGQDTYRYAYLV